MMPDLGGTLYAGCPVLCQLSLKQVYSSLSRIHTEKLACRRLNYGVISRVAPRIIIDFPDIDGQPGRRFFHAPQRVITASHARDIPSALAEIEADCAAGATAIGFLSYEAAPAFDAAFITHAPSQVPLLWFALFEHEQQATTAGSAAPDAIKWAVDTTRAEHAQAIAQIREEIAAGATYQVNFTVRMHGQFTGDALALYESLRRAQGVGYHAYIETADWCVISLSPELFFETVNMRTIRARPMKGTRGRGRMLAEDEALADELRGSAKERAENLMIVDLMRNDIGRVAQAGSVQVTRLYDVERYPTVQQLTSTVEATLRPDTSLPDIMGALFPPGSVTGAPKISTMRLINELEKTPRGIYCGALGMVAGSSCTFNVPIRTIWLDRATGRAQYGTGGGITADSQAEHEYDELLTKTLVVSQPWPTFELLETMRAEAGEIVRLDRHLRRLEQSAEYFDFAFCPDKLERVLTEARSQVTKPTRLRLLLAPDGSVRIEQQLLEPTPTNPQVQLAQLPVSSRNRFLFHKTTHRRAYDKHAEAAPAAFDVLLYNEHDALTEFTRGNVVLELKGERVTPAQDAGLLAGVFRGELLDRGEVTERTITRSELAHATRIWFINSVREWVEVKLG
jgi:para-aminobenzoate synthetase/4-amino-4-deoxychorismate lyase